MPLKFWYMLVDFKVASYYYQFYSVLAARQKRAVSAICLIASSSCVVTWCSSGKYGLLWATLIVIAQLIAVIQPVFPYEKRYHAACYIYEDVNRLCTEAESRFFSFTTATSDDEISCLIQSFRNAYDQIENRFASADTFPEKHRLHRRAEKNADIYFRRFQP